MSIQECFEIHIFMLIEKLILFLVLVEVVAWMPELVSVITQVHLWERHFEILLTYFKWSQVY